MAGEASDLTVVIPAYKAEALIARALTSLAAQPDVRLQIIVVVDGIYDRTAAIASHFPGVTVLVNEKNQGAPAARNRGLAVASAPFVLFLDADDYVEGPLLSGLLHTARRDRRDIAFGPAMREWRDGSREMMRGPTSSEPLDIIREWLLGRFLAPCAVLWRTEFVRRIDGWRERLIHNDDGELVYRGLLAGARVGYSDGGVAIYVQHDGPERVSRRRNVEAERSNLEVGVWLAEQLRSRDALTEPLRRALVTSFYTGMRRSYACGHPSLAADYAEQWRTLCGTRHEGTAAHRLACQLLGLRRKEQISATLRHRLNLAKRRGAAMPFR